MTDALVEWLSHHLEQLHQSTFLHYRGIFGLVQVVHAAEDGRIPRFAAYSALRSYNQDKGTYIEYDEVKNLDSTFIFSDAGEWVVFTDRPADIICGDHDDPEDALSNAPESVRFILVWDVRTNYIVVYRSPFTDLRERESVRDGVVFTLGEEKGNTPSFVLPPEVEASLHEMAVGEILRR